jgi:hypothetical protein
MEYSYKASSYLAHANSLLVNYHDSIVRPALYKVLADLSTNPPSYTISVYPDDPVVAIHTDTSGNQILIFHYEDFMIPRPLD